VGGGFMKLENKRYLVTGAGSGLGKALVRRLKWVRGTKIVAVTSGIDVSKPENIECMLDFAIKRTGGLDCVIACAGFGYYESFGDKGYEHIRRIFETNVLSPIYTLERFLAKTEGNVAFVMVSSMLGKFGLAGMTLYSATKHALAGFADAYKLEKPKRLHYMTAYPITIKTNFWNKLPKDIPIPKPMQTADTAAKAILRGLRKNKKSIYTAPFSKVFTDLTLPYQLIGSLKFQKWLVGASIARPTYADDTIRH